MKDKKQKNISTVLFTTGYRHNPTKPGAWQRMIKEELEEYACSKGDTSHLAPKKKKIGSGK